MVLLLVRFFPGHLLTTFAHPCTGFWQYGTLQWGEFYRYLNEFVRTPTDWAIFSHEPNQSWLDHGALHPPGAEIVQPGSYILLSTGEYGNQACLLSHLLSEL
jgi:hypothetical protein